MDTSPHTAVTWMMDGTAVGTSPDRISTGVATLSFSPVATSDSGRYTCQLTVTTSQTHITVRGPVESAAENITIQSKVLRYCIFTYLLIHPVPPPDVTATLNYTSPLYAGTGLTLTCTVTLDPNVDNGERVVTEWSGPRDISGDRYSVTGASGSGSTYTDSLTISPLADLDDGTYTCTVTVTGGSNVQQVTASDDVNITVLGK